MVATPCAHYLSLPQVLCPPGTWSNVTGLSGPCTQPCAPGYVCAAGSTTAAPRPCGSPDVYCPQGTGEAIPVPSGFYSWGGFDNGTTRVGVSPCPAPGSNGGVGVHCPTGLGSMLPCAAGYYGNASQLNVSTCSGPCAAGYYCPLGSSSPTMNPCGSAAVYVAAVSQETVRATLLSDLCFSCCPLPREPGSQASVLAPLAPFPSTHALDRYCPVGSGVPIPVPDGHFSAPESDDVALRREALPCPSGSYCVAGARLLCPSGGPPMQ